MPPAPSLPPKGRSGGFHPLAWLRDVWLMAGITLLLFLVLEGAYRVQHSIRHPEKPETPQASADSSLHPYAGAAWWKDFQGQAELGARRNRFDPYRGFWPGPATGRYVNVDSFGRRITPQPAVTNRPARQVFFLGGSTMWGYTARDSFTIPAFTAARLRELGIEDVEIVNLAQGAYNLTQDLNTLTLSLARGDRPAAAVFLDGYNDIMTGLKFAEPGHTYGDDDIQRRIELGGRGFWKEILGFGRYSALIGRLQAMVGAAPDGPRARGAAEEVCGPIAAYFRGVSGVIAGVGRSFDFPTLFFLQPVHVSTAKHLTPWEAGLYHPRGLQACLASIDSAMTDPLPGAEYVSLSGLFDADTTSVFVDGTAHVTEEANGIIAEMIAQHLAPLLSAGRKPGRSLPH